MISSSDFKFKPYLAPFYVGNGHINTILGSFFTIENLAFLGSRELVKYADGNQTSVYVHDYDSEWVILSFHGLGGDVSMLYQQMLT